MDVDLPAYTNQLANTYYTDLYPFEFIHRFVTCNRANKLSPQCREMRLECFSWRRDEQSGKWYCERGIDGRSHITRFNRKNGTNLRDMLHIKLPVSIHIKNLLPIQLAPETFLGEGGEGGFASTASQKRKRDFTESRLRLDDLRQDTTLRESNGRDYIHIIDRCKELVFDVDVPDFDRFCECGVTHSKILCPVCWLHIEGSYYIIRFIMTAVFGYGDANLLFVFSGGKGMHCFNNDARAMSLNQGQRDAIYNYVHIGKEDDVALCKWIIDNATPELTAQLEQLFMETVIKGRDLFRSQRARQWVGTKLAKHYPATYQSIRSWWCLDDARAFFYINKAHNVSESLWARLIRHSQYENRDPGNAMRVVGPVQFLIYRLYYPMIDAGPLALKHEIKLPFSIHTTTTNLALPFDERFIRESDKASLLITLERLCNYFKFQRVGEVLPLYRNAIVLLDAWLSAYA